MKGPCAMSREPEAAVSFRCPGCNRRYTVPDYLPGRRYKCSVCRVYLEKAEGPKAPSGEVSRGDPFEGRVLGGFRLLRRLGKGGMGMVYLGEGLADGRKVAVKVLTEEVSRMPGIQKRFEREGTASARLEHPNIAATLDMGREGSLAFIVTEYVGGGSLEDLLRREKRLSPARAVEILSGILEGLQHAHDRGVIHRDIKPANVLLATDGTAKLIDFGLARDAEAQSILTVTGTVMGTPSFMSPEQAKGERGGPLSDQYACGILGWYMMTGRKPFEGKGIMDVLMKQVHEPLPSARLLNPEIPPALDRVLARMAAKDPERRYPDAGAAAAALRQALAGRIEETEDSPRPAPVACRGTSPPAVRRLRDSVWFWGLIGALAGTVIALAWRFLR